MASFDAGKSDAESVPPFLLEKHAAYIKTISNDKVSFEFTVSQHFRMSGVYWGLTALSLLGKNLADEINVDEISAWVMECQHECGGFGGSVNHDTHILYTLSALQILALLDRLDLVADKRKVARYVASLQQADGSFIGDKWGEVDTRFSYCALSSLALLGELHSPSEECVIDLPLAVDFVSRCRNFDGGFGAVPGAESHAGQIFCCVGALSIAGALDRVDRDLLGWWLSERQCDSGGLNGRPEKQADVCYSWWILSCLRILGRVSWIDKEKLATFILQCQGVESYCVPCLDLCGGGIADRPGNMVDIFHTFFGISGLSLLGYFSKPDWNPDGESTELPVIDPTYAMPSYVVERLGLPSQVLSE
mmetsp:Transcript_6241/g.10194  ORF Transcript_6241/g.10194 Transcript_6241/m.10194 type:complete len:363 (+) Transcript_6241:95-1183(+)|eukprot:CAMPEP_0114428412 /NCGR_PEP_ID=MMETSP0103-20121206/8911_1 /TAXON_ID=37642 ORGANISM="Paraphysomonas imperforata, Strain PA2" /NCGR_SAMPLE_ID=MMETSP0103 /ASSEMBLY_ACC=CAM_ASM_000201 /LENGTH=362 /DNA_ID=CAMNT_0001597625 /DNA_START=73 /DNA_END=1161 /DNA_ORIENTATION=+